MKQAQSIGGGGRRALGERIAHRLPALPAGCRLPYYLAAEERRDARVRIEGRWLVDFGSNDYLGLGRDPRVLERSAAAILRHGAGAGSAAILGGALELHEELQRELAEWMGQEAALLFPSGFQACTGAVLALGARNRVVLDREAHSSLVEGARSARQGFRRFSTERLATLERALSATADDGRSRGALVVVDGVYSMSGRVCPLGELYEIAERYDALVLVDEAHSLGVLGGGRGASHAAGLDGRGILQVGTFSKALGACGGFVAGPTEVIEGLRSTCPQAVFTAALAPALCAAALESLRILRAEPERAVRVAELADTLRLKLRAGGLSVPAPTGGGTTPIVPVFFEDERALFETWQRLFDAGFSTSPVVAPACPRGSAMLRLSCTWGHALEDLEALADVLTDSVGRRAGGRA